MRHMANRDPDSLAGRIMPRMMVYSVSQPDLYAEYFDRVIMPRRRWLYAVLREGIDSGELRADLNVELAAAGHRRAIHVAIAQRAATPDRTPTCRIG